MLTTRQIRANFTYLAGAIAKYGHSAPGLMQPGHSSLAVLQKTCIGHHNFNTLIPPGPHIPSLTPSSLPRSGVTRTHMLGHVRQALDHDNGEDATVVVCGWVQRRRMLGKLLFIELRDHTGVIQAIWAPESITQHSMTPEVEKELQGKFSLLANIPTESVVSLKGVLQRRPLADVRSGPNGDVELQIVDSLVLNESAHLPVTFNLENVVDKKSKQREQEHREGHRDRREKEASVTVTLSDDDALLRYRFLDIRRPSLQRVLRLRSLLTLAVRNALSNRGFVEVETPLLVRSTPEGAREFIVPSRQHLTPSFRHIPIPLATTFAPGHFYALPQSPQQHKQLLMCGGIDKYFQIARCFRDESGRPDRQPEFTQIDLELSFVDQWAVMKEIERFIRQGWIALSTEILRYQLTDVKPQEELQSPPIKNTEMGQNAQPQEARLNMYELNGGALPTLGPSQSCEGSSRIVFKPPKGLPLPQRDKTTADPSLTFPAMRYIDAINYYGSDKPDIRYGLEMLDVTDCFTNHLLNNLTASSSSSSPADSIDLAFPDPLLLDPLIRSCVMDGGGEVEVILSQPPTSAELCPRANTSPNTQAGSTTPSSSPTYKLCRPGAFVTNLMAAAGSQKGKESGKELDEMDMSKVVIKAIVVRGMKVGVTKGHTSTSSGSKVPNSKKTLNARGLAELVKEEVASALRSMVSTIPGVTPNGMVVQLDVTKWNAHNSLRSLNDPAVKTALTSALGLESGDFVYLFAGRNDRVSTILGKVRLLLGKLALDGIISGRDIFANAFRTQWLSRLPPSSTPPIDSPSMHWVVDFPLFEVNWDKVAEIDDQRRTLIDSTNDQDPDRISINGSAGEPKYIINEDLLINMQDRDKLAHALTHTIPLSGRPLEPLVVATHHPFTTCHEDDDDRLFSILDTIFSTQVIPIHPMKPSGVNENGENTANKGNEMVCESAETESPSHQQKAYYITRSQLQAIAQIRAQHYDLVSNGLEVGGGSIRVHHEQKQRKIFKLLNVDGGQFAHLLEALSFGCPPHGGFAAGLDRLVSIFTSPSPHPLRLRDVIAFPKTQAGRDIMLNSPAKVTEEQLKEYGIEIRKTN